jgi:hypothetical protein
MTSSRAVANPEPRSLLRNFDGSVIVPARVAEEIAPVLREAMESRCKRDGWKFTSAAWDVLDGLVVAGHLSRARRLLDAGLDASRGQEHPIGTVDPVVSASVSEVVGLRAAGKILGCTPQAVHDRVTRGTLPCRRDERGHLVFDRRNLEVVE